MKNGKLYVGDLDMTDIARLAAVCQVRPKHIVATMNLERVRGYMETHLGCRPKEIAHALNLPADQAVRLVRKLRNEWAQI